MFRIIFGIIWLQCLTIAINCKDCPDKPEVVCFWGSWSFYRKDLGEFTTANIDPELCSTIVYSFVGLNSNLELASLDPYTDIDKGGFKNLTLFRNNYPCLKITVAMGGWNEGSLKYSVVASSEERRKKFADSVLNLLTYYEFDGFDLDWEFPASRGGISSDKLNFIELLKEIKNKISPWNFKLSIAIPFQEELLKSGYEISEIHKFVDSIRIMTYDNVSPTSQVTGLAAPMSIIESTIPKLITNGVPRNKIILGIPAYGRCFKLKDPKLHDIGSPVLGPGEPGYLTSEAGFLSYNEILDALANDMKVVLNDGTKYAYDDMEWITYDDQETVKRKVKYAMTSKLGGIMLWSIDLDDFRGRYHKKFPLLSAINEALDGK